MITRDADGWIRCAKCGEAITGECVEVDVIVDHDLEHPTDGVLCLGCAYGEDGER